MAKLTSDIIDEIAASFDRVGGSAYLDELAMRDPPTYCRLVARILPSALTAEVQTTTNPINLGEAMAAAEVRLNKPEK
jgi:hypothetical protein